MKKLILLSFGLIFFSQKVELRAEQQSLDEPQGGVFSKIKIPEYCKTDSDCSHLKGAKCVNSGCAFVK